MDRIALRDHDWTSLERALQEILTEQFGTGATISLAAARSAEPTDAQGVEVQAGDGAHLHLPPGTPEKVAAGIAQRVGALVADFAALDQARVRASRLASLYGAAQLLSAELDTDRILTRIVEQARELSGADASYLSLNDTELEETYFRATSGIRTEEFRNLRLKFGQGLGGLVASEARSYRSDDYLHDARFLHVVDPTVLAEGIVSVIGVPLGIGSEVLGVLFVGSRSQGTFTDEDVRICEDLAGHAAVAIANAQLYGRLRREQALRDRLTDVALEAHDLSSLEGRLGEALGHRVQITVLPAGGDVRGVRRDQAVAESDGVVEAPIQAGAVRLGTLRVRGLRLDEEGRYGVEQAARVAALHILRDRLVAQGELRGRSELVAAINDRRLPDHLLVDRARHFGLDLGQPLRVLAVQGDVTTRTWPAGLFTAGRAGITLALVPEGVHLPAVESVAGLSRVARGPREVAAAIEEAIRTLSIATALRRSGAVTVDDLGPLSVVVEPERAARMRADAERALAPLMEHDRGGTAGLLATLRAFLEFQGRPGEAASHCGVHVNTYYYRLDRIRSLTGWQLGDPDVRLHLHLCCRLLDLTGAPGGDLLQGPDPNL